MRKLMLLLVAVALAAAIGPAASAHIRRGTHPSANTRYIADVTDGTGRIWVEVEVDIWLTVRGRPDVKCTVRTWDNYYGEEFFTHRWRDVPYNRTRDWSWVVMSGQSYTESVRHCHLIW